MAGAWKFIKWGILGITGLFLALVLFLFFWIDPNDYRDEIATAVKDNTGMVLDIKGDIGWNFYPALGFQVADLSLKPAAGEPDLATLGKAAVSVQLLPLFSQQVNVKTLYIDALHANLVVDADGNGNWAGEAGKKGKGGGKGKGKGDKAGADDAAAAGDAAVADAAPADAAAETDAAAADAVAADAAPAEPMAVPDIRIPEIVITNSVIDYKDQQAGSHQTVSIKEFVAEDVNFGDEFPLRLIASVNDNAGMTADIDLRTFVRAHLADNLFSVRELQLTTVVGGVFDKPAKATVSGDLSADLNAGLAKVGPLAFSFAGMQGTLGLDVKDINTAMAWNGKLAIAPFNAKQLMRELGMAAPETTDALAMTAIAVNADLVGGATAAMLENIDINVDGSHLRGKAGIADMATTLMVFDLALDSINADRYLPPAKKGKKGEKAAADANLPQQFLLAGVALAAEAAPAAADGKKKGKKKDKPAGELLPVETLRTLNVDGRFTAGTITMMGLPLTGIETAVKAGGGEIAVNPVHAKVGDGSVDGRVNIDARGEVPNIASHLRLDRVEIGGIVRQLAGEEVLTGRTSLKLDTNGSGNDMDTLLKQTRGSLDFSLDNAVLKGTNLGNLLTQTISSQLGSFSMLVPDYQQKLQKEISGDTQLTTLTAAATLGDGIAHVTSMKATLRDGSLNGTGDFDMVKSAFDFQLAMRTDKLKDNKYFADSEFPVRCKGNMKSAASEWCSPDGKAIGDMIGDVAKKAAKDRFTGELSNKLGIDFGGADGAKAADAQKKKDRATQGAKEKATQEIDRALQKYF